MRVIKRNGNSEEVSFDKVIRRIKSKCMEEPVCKKVDYVSIAQKVCSRIYDGVKTHELDELSANICIGLSTDEPEYGYIASRLIISNNHKNTPNTFKDSIDLLYNNIDTNGNRAPLVSDNIYKLVNIYGDKIESIIDYKRDYNYNYFGFKVLENSYLKKVNNKVVERPQHMLMRVSLGIHMDTDDTRNQSLVNTFNTYNYMSLGYFIHATPTLFNSGTGNSNLLSCFLLGMDDSISGIFKCIGDCAEISKGAGGIGFNISNIRSKDSYIKGSGGKSNGIIPMLRVFNSTALYVNQCFHPDTIIYTDNGPKLACTINDTDNVVTYDGTYKPVLKVVKNKIEKKLYIIKTQHNILNTKCTGEHQIYTIQTTDSKLSIQTLINLKKNGQIEASYVNASELKKGDLLCHPIPKYNNIETYDNEYMRFYGIWISNGYDDKYGNIGIKLSNRENKTYDFIISFLNTNKINYQIIENILKKNIQIRWNHKMFHLLKDNDRNRTFINPKYFKATRNNIIELLKGMLEGLKKNTRNVNIKVSSYACACSIKQLFLITGYLLKGYRGKRKIILNVPLWEEFFDESDNIKTTRNKEFVELDGVLWTRIKSIRNNNYKGDVYDFNIQDNHNYLTELGLVHNSGKRNGSFAVYIEPWHADIFDFLELKKNHGDEAARCRDLFLGLWIPDIFMERVFNSGDWCLMDPDECPGLTKVYGSEFKILYEKYENENKYRKKIPARTLWNKILESQIETGVPYICYKDAINNKSNQKNIGTIMNSNLCSEIAEYSDAEEYACCTLASIGLPAFVVNNQFDYVALAKCVKTIVYNLNRIIDINSYPVPETKRSNERHRPLGIGVQGLADVYIRLKMPFDSPEASVINKQIFATIYYAALEESHHLSTTIAQEYLYHNINLNSWDLAAFKTRIQTNRSCIGAYSTFEGSPISLGQFQFDMWGVLPIDHAGELSFDWESLRNKIMKDGIRNSLLIAPMPTASTSQILGYNECFEPITSNIYVRRVLAGEFIVINNYLINDLQNLGIWSKELKDKIILNNGSIQNITEIPKDIQNLYKTSWDISMKNIIDQAADRGAYICQTQSLNLFLSKPDFKSITNMHFYSWKKGLKTGIYYLRTQAAAKAQQITLTSAITKKNEEAVKNENTECLMCSS